MNNNLSLTTVDKVRATSSDLTDGISDDTLKLLIEDASIQVIADDFPKTVNNVPIQELAARYLALHLITTQSVASSESVISEKVDVIEKHYSDKSRLDWLKLSPYGRMYLRLYNRYAGDLGLMVIEYE
ncbi:DUF4054 domain-containing protein [Lactobacillus sp.]|uniref:DUF4054 domain-containing protein n=1 Tax=Lactobacillus sp. TaxID=1591 RepID=UPI0019BFC464|nr:DUF4054 domain-containing protein [Lactobacillus sp.]MBD5430138.1 DUF4054 domain-containing protein [Lactobacillus sp.]